MDYHSLVHRLSAKISNVDLILGKLGIEFETGVMISELRDDVGLDSGLCVGARLFHVNGIPVTDPLQAKALVQGLLSVHQVWLHPTEK